MTGSDGDEPVVEVSSPACAMHEAEDSYMGFATTAEVKLFLEELLVVERALALRLKDMLPRIRDARLHQDFTNLLRSHEAAIAAAEDCLAKRR